MNFAGGGEPAALGSIVPVEVTQAYPHSLVGRVAEVPAGAGA